MTTADRFREALKKIANAPGALTATDLRNLARHALEHDEPAAGAEVGGETPGRDRG